MKSTPWCLLALALFGSLCDAQFGKPPNQKPYEPQKPSNPQQTKTTFEKQLTWKYPEDPKPEPKTEVPFELRHPVSAETVGVECRERDARVEVRKDFFGIGQFINPADITLGDCPVQAEDLSAQVLIFESELHECSSVTVVSTWKMAADKM